MVKEITKKLILKIGNKLLTFRPIYNEKGKPGELNTDRTFRKL